MVDRSSAGRGALASEIVIVVATIVGAGAVAALVLAAGGSSVRGTTVLAPELLAGLAAAVTLLLGMLAVATLRLRARRERARGARLTAANAALGGRGLSLVAADGDDRVLYVLDAPGSVALADTARPGAPAAQAVAEAIAASDEAVAASLVAMAGAAAVEGPQRRDFSDPRSVESGRMAGRILRVTVAAAGGGTVYAIEDITRAHAEATRNSDRLALLTRALDRAPFGILVADENRKILESNTAFRRLMGGEPAVGRVLGDLVHADDRAPLDAAVARVFESGQPAAPVDVRLIDDSERVVAIYASHATLPRDGKRGLVLHAVDATERKRLEAQFAQSQKMQAVGQLAGGIAHDFNNMLTAMIGFCDLLLQRHQVGDPSFADAMQIKQNANRAAGLVRQLLAFSRQQSLAPRVIDVTDVLGELSNLMRRLLGEHVELSVVHGRELWPVKADQGQFEQVIINLAVNARDAMPDGGRLTVQTGNFSADRPYTLGDEVMPPGDYVAVTVSDTGMGMGKETLERVFEPFFTTKEVGTGTGLGLAMVYGSLRQLGGFVHAHSDGPGRGASFTLYLPRSEGQPVETGAVMDGEPGYGDTTGGGSVLLVEDEDAVRLFAARALRSKGYQVTEARTGEAALELLADPTPFNLLVTDMVMPKVDGATLIREARKERPDLPVICISGYTQESVAQEVEALPQVYFLPKPFSLKQLAAKVKAAIESAAKTPV